MSTLSELNVKVGDVVSYGDGYCHYEIRGRLDVYGCYPAFNLADGFHIYLRNEGSSPWFIVSRASDKQIGTPSELNVKPGDILECLDWRGNFYRKGVSYPVVSGWGERGVSIGTKGVVGEWKVISRASDTTVSTPTLWKDMTPEEKGAILIAAHEGKKLQCYSKTDGGWLDCISVADDSAYRIKPEPVVESVTQYWKTNKKGKFVPMHMSDEPTPASKHNPTHKITFNVVDGEPDVTSIRMECMK